MSPQDRQHVVPQVHLRRFANKHNRLWVVTKHNPLSIKHRSPEDIAWVDQYYTDELGDDFDKQFLQYIETQVGRLSPNGPIDTREAEKAVFFAISTLWRTDFVLVLCRGLAGHDFEISNNKIKLAVNSVRSELMQFTASWLGQGWSLQIVNFPKKCLITSDQPVYPAHMDFELPCFLIYPFDSQTCLFIGPPDLESLNMEVSAFEINRQTVAWAKDEIYCPTPQIRNWTSELLDSGSPELNPLWIRSAHRPYYSASSWLPFFTVPPPVRFVDISNTKIEISGFHTDYMRQMRHDSRDYQQYRDAFRRRIRVNSV